MRQLSKIFIGPTRIITHHHAIQHRLHRLTFMQQQIIRTALTAIPALSEKQPASRVSSSGVSQTFPKAFVTCTDSKQISSGIPAASIVSADKTLAENADTTHHSGRCYFFIKTFSSIATILLSIIAWLETRRVNHLHDLNQIRIELTDIIRKDISKSITELHREGHNLHMGELLTMSISDRRASSVENYNALSILLQLRQRILTLEKTCWVPDEICGFNLSVVKKEVIALKREINFRIVEAAVIELSHKLVFNLALFNGSSFCESSKSSNEAKEYEEQIKKHQKSLNNILVCIDYSVGIPGKILSETDSSEKAPGTDKAAVPHRQIKPAANRTSQLEALMSIPNLKIDHSVLLPDDKNALKSAEQLAVLILMDKNEVTAPLTFSHRELSDNISSIGFAFNINARALEALDKGKSNKENWLDILACCHLAHVIAPNNTDFEEDLERAKKNEPLTQKKQKNWLDSLVCCYKLAHVIAPNNDGFDEDLEKEKKNTFLAQVSIKETRDAQETSTLRQQVLRKNDPRKDAWKHKGDGSPTVHHFLAKYNGETIGVVSIYEDPKTIEGKTYHWCLYSTAIDPEYQGLGVGTKLVSKCIHQLIALKNPDAPPITIWANARDDDKVIKFYQSFGFDWTGERVFSETYGRYFRVIKAEHPKPVSQNIAHPESKKTPSFC